MNETLSYDQYQQAHTLRDARFNFELELPLNTGPNGAKNPFYVDRLDNPLVDLRDELLGRHYRPPKYFLSGHRGCGKSTELRQLASDPEIQQNYWVVHFSIRDEADIEDIDFRDVLIIIANQLYQTYTKRDNGGTFPLGLMQEMERWQVGLKEEITRTVTRGWPEMEVSAGLSGLLSQLGAKLKFEPATRNVVRQLFESRVTELIGFINAMSAVIQAQTGNLPLILIDDLDKPSLNKAVEIFYNQRATMMRPNLAIVYTLSSALFYDPRFNAIGEEAIFLPNIKLRNRANGLEAAGYETMTQFIERRMSRDLIAEEALQDAIRFSGGVFRELARILRTSITRARRRRATQIDLADVTSAVNEIRNEYRRFLTLEDLELMLQIRRSNDLGSQTEAEHDRQRNLLKILALLEYHNDENWCDVHPALDALLG